MKPLKRSFFGITRVNCFLRARLSIDQKNSCHNYPYLMDLTGFSPKLFVSTALRAHISLARAGCAASIWRWEMKQRGGRKPPAEETVSQGPAMNHLWCYKCSTDPGFLWGFGGHGLVIIPSWDGATPLWSSNERPLMHFHAFFHHSVVVSHLGIAVINLQHLAAHVMYPYPQTAVVENLVGGPTG